MDPSFQLILLILVEITQTNEVKLGSKEKGTQSEPQNDSVHEVLFFKLSLGGCLGPEFKDKGSFNMLLSNVKQLIQDLLS